MFTKKHYEKIAQIIDELPMSFKQQRYWSMADTSFSEELANQFAAEFKLDNPNFNKTKFFNACGIHKDSVIRNDDMVQVMGVYINKNHLKYKSAKESKENHEIATV